MKQIEFLTLPSVLKLPFSKAVRDGDMLYLSGELGLDYSTGKLVEGGITAEAKQVMDNIKRSLDAFGSSMDSIIKVTVMIVDMKEWPQFNEIYVTYFKDGRLPARSAFGTTALAFGAKLEVECIAKINK